MHESSSTFKDSYADGPRFCIGCGKKPTRRGKVTISDDLEFIRIRYYCRSRNCGEQFDAVYKMFDLDVPEEKGYSVL